MEAAMIRTELEHCVLGVIWQRGPCSAYRVRSEFAKSPSAHWSASAGSIYPVAERLIAAGLVRVTHTQTGARATRELTVTPEGVAAIRSWIARIDRLATSATYDPVRTRLLFIHALDSVEDRRQVLRSASAETQARLAELEALDLTGEPMEALVMLGARHELQARLAWLLEIEPILAAGGANK
jgi:DNA-binding PadR family transcriptional regulator